MSWLGDKYDAIIENGTNAIENVVECYKNAGEHLKSGNLAGAIVSGTGATATAVGNLVTGGAANKIGEIISDDLESGDANVVEEAIGKAADASASYEDAMDEWDEKTAAGWSDSAEYISMAKEHFENGNWGYGIYNSLYGGLEMVGNSITLGSGAALGETIADKLDYGSTDAEAVDNSKWGTAKEGESLNWAEKIISRWAKGEADSIILEENLESNGDTKSLAYANLYGVAETANLALTAVSGASLLSAGKQMAKSAAASVTGKELVSASAKKAGTEVVKDTAEAGTKEAIEKTAEESSKTLAKGAIEGAAEKEVSAVATEAGTKEIAEKAIETSTKEAVEKTVGKELVEKEASAAITEASTKTVAEKATEAGVKEVVADTAEKKAIKAASRAAFKKSTKKAVAAAAMTRLTTEFNSFRLNSAIKTSQQKGSVWAGIAEYARDDVASLVSDTGNAASDVIDAVSDELNPITKWLKEHTSIAKFVNTCRASGHATAESFSKFTPVAMASAAVSKFTDMSHTYDGYSIKQIANQRKEESEANDSSWGEVYAKRVAELDAELGVDSSTRLIYGNTIEDYAESL
jgi:hypothetical protein